jgi:FMN phosphatase YigB (HAD superfamily)
MYVFDFNVVFVEDPGLAVKYIDTVNLMKYIVQNPGATGTVSTCHLREKFNEYLSSISGRGISRPKILEDWFRGSIDGDTALKRLDDTDKLMNNIAMLTFKADRLKMILKPNTLALKAITCLLRSSHSLGLAGNIDRETLNKLRDLHPTLFKCFQMECLSCDINFVKPEKAFYKALLEKTPRRRCVLIDDSFDRSLDESVRCCNLKTLTFSLRNDPEATRPC